MSFAFFVLVQSPSRDVLNRFMMLEQAAENGDTRTNDFMLSPKKFGPGQAQARGEAPGAADSSDFPLPHDLPDAP